jgi:hypothetical protein
MDKMNDLVNICFMSRHRLERLLTAIKFVRDNTQGINYIISLLFDDDRESYDACKLLGYDCYLYSPQQECVMMTNNCFRLTKELGINYFVFLNDDMEVQKDWLKNALNDFKKTFPDEKGVVSFNSYITNGTRGGDTFCIVGLTTISFIEEDLNGVFFDPTFVHNEGDGEFTYRAMFLDKFKWCQEAMIHHRHPLIDASLFDETYKASQIYFASDLINRNKMFQARGWTERVMTKLILKQKSKKEIFSYYIKKILKIFFGIKKINSPKITRLNSLDHVDKFLKNLLAEQQKNES